MSLKYPGERSAQAIQDAKKVAAKLSTLADDLWNTLDDLDRHLATIQQCDPAEDLKRLRERLEQIHNLRRQMELASFAGIWVPRVVNIVWDKLP